MEPTGEEPTVETPWRCPTCGTDATTAFCGACGEQRLAPGDLSLRHYASAAAESLLSWDGRILGTFASFLRRPGELTLAYVDGRRKPFLNPLQLFLLVNVLYFVQQGVTNWNTYSTPFAIHVMDTWYADAAKTLARIRMDQLGLPYEGPEFTAFVQRFNAAVKLSAKSLLILLVPFVTLLVTAVRLGRPRQAGVHLTAGLHVTAYLVACQTVVLPLATVVQRVAVARGTPLAEPIVDDVTTWVINGLVAVASAGVFRRAFGSPTVWAWIQAVILAWFIFDAVKAYRLVLYVVTLFATR